MPDEDAQMTHSRRAPTEVGETAEPADLVVRRWRHLRQMLVQQLEMFEGGGLTLHANEVNVSTSAIADLKTSIGEFDALISQEAARARRN